MKRFKKSAFLLVVGGALMCAMAVFAFDRPALLTPSVIPENGMIGEEAGEMEVGPRPAFNSFTGEVQRIEPLALSEDQGQYLIHVDGEAGPAVFFVEGSTFLLGDTPAVGDTITGHYATDRPMILIYPPQYTAAVIVNGDFLNVKVDRFDEDLLSMDGMLQLNISDETEIILQSGAPFTDDLANRKLVVVYGISTRSIPAIAVPDQVIVLYEQFMTLPEVIGLPEDWEEIETSWIPYEIFVNGQGLAGVRYRSINGTAVLLTPEGGAIEAQIFPTHVPLRAVAEALGTQVGWNAHAREVTLEGLKGEIAFKAGTAHFTVAGEAITLSESSAVIEGRTYVPLSFFREVFGMNHAYFEGGHIFIHHEGVME